MRRSQPLAVRFKDLFGKFGKGKKAPDPKAESLELSPDHAEARERQEEEMQRRRKVSMEQRLLDGEDPESLDPVFARGFLKSLYCYTPPKDLNVQVLEALSDAGFDVPEGDWSSINLKDDPILKFKVLTMLEARLDRSVPNSRLHEMKTVADVHRFYQEPVSNRTSFTELARSKNKPKNLFVIEQPLRFFPEEVHLEEGENVADASPHRKYALLHKGVTAFPKLSGELEDLREKRLYRQFQSKSEWHHYKDKYFHYEDTPPEAPWGKECAEKGDRVSTRKGRFTGSWYS